MSKTPDYTKKAIADYQKRNERIAVLFKSGTKQRIFDKYGENINISGYIKTLVENDLNDNMIDLNGNGTKSDSLPWDN